MDEFLETYRTFEKEQLFQIVLFPDEYKEEAILAAKQVITEKGWKRELDKALEQQNIKEQEEQEQYEQDVIDKAEYYKNYVELKNEGISFQINKESTVLFEDKLIENNIEFFRADKQIISELNYDEDCQTYYLKKTDYEKAIEIKKELGLSMPKPKTKLEKNTYILAIIGFAVYILYELYDLIYTKTIH